MKRVRNHIEFGKARAKLGFSQIVLAEIMRLPNPQVGGSNTIRRWEHGTNRIPGSAMVLMEALLTGWLPAHWKGKK
jgi:DNA-binding transcriptional regulator YiaG